MSTTHARDGLDPAQSCFRSIDDGGGSMDGACRPGVPSGISNILSQHSTQFKRAILRYCSCNVETRGCRSACVWALYWRRFEYVDVHRRYLTRSCKSKGRTLQKWIAGVSCGERSTNRVRVGVAIFSLFPPNVLGKRVSQASK